LIYQKQNVFLSNLKLKQKSRTKKTQKLFGFGNVSDLNVLDNLSVSVKRSSQNISSTPYSRDSSSICVDEFSVKYPSPNVSRLYGKDTSSTVIGSSSSVNTVKDFEHLYRNVESKEMWL
jgi:hypothetical protein